MFEKVKYPYGLCADLHFHSWNAFSSIETGGINSRLSYLLKDLRRCAEEVKAKGGNTIFMAGDVFHVRGSIAPSVLNPVMDAMCAIIEDLSLQIVAIAGNHDLEGKEAARLGSAITALEGVGVIVVEKTNFVITDGDKQLFLISWVEDIAALKDILASIPVLNRKGIDVIIHAPIDGVIYGLPEHGLTDKYLADLGYDRVFAGHYHNHKDFDNGVYSIGALAHHTWSDIGTKAGFLLVGEDTVEYRSSRSPKFIEIDETTDMDELPLIADGNYLRAKIGNVTSKEVEEMRELLKTNGAIGSVIHAIKSPVEERGDAPMLAGKSVSVETSIADYITSEKFASADAVLRKSLELLSKVETV